MLKGDDWEGAIAAACCGLEQAGVRFVLVVEGLTGQGGVLSNVKGTLKLLEGAVGLVEAGAGGRLLEETLQ